MFLGCHDHVLDEKGRTSLPKDFRKQFASLADDPVLTSLDDCLAIYPADAFDRLLAHYSQPGLNQARERLKRLTIGMACRISVDRQGRILIAGRLRELAGLERDIVFTGVGNYIEIWDRSRHERAIEKTRNEYGDLTKSAGEVPQ